MSDLTVLTVVENDSGLFDLMYRSVMAFTDAQPQFIVCNNGGSLHKGNNIRSIVGNPGTLVGGSNRHGHGLHKILPMSKTKYTAIVESDVVITDKSWSKIKPGCKIKASIKSPGLYHCCFMVFETALLRGMDFRPGMNDKERARTRNYKPKRDVGWRLSEYIKDTNIDYSLFIDCKSGNGKHFNNGFQSDEFHDMGGKCIAAHLGRGSNIKGKAVRKGFKHPVKQRDDWKVIAERIISNEERRKNKGHITKT